MDVFIMTLSQVRGQSYWPEDVLYRGETKGQYSHPEANTSGEDLN